MWNLFDEYTETSYITTKRKRDSHIKLKKSKQYLEEYEVWRRERIYIYMLWKKLPKLHKREWSSKTKQFSATIWNYEFILLTVPQSIYFQINWLLCIQASHNFFNVPQLMVRNAKFKIYALTPLLLTERKPTNHTVRNPKNVNV